MTAPFLLYRLQPPAGSGFHFGEQGLDLEESNVVFPSDSLFAAVVATIAEQEGGTAVETFIAPFNEQNPPFLLTSVFPRAGDLPLLPLPHLPIHTQTQATAAGDMLLPRKFTKKVRFVSPAICRQLCAGADMDSYLTAENGRFLQQGTVWLTAAEQAHLPEKWRTFPPTALNQQTVWNRGSVPRVTIDRVHNNSNIYLMGRVTFNQDCGLWLGVQYNDTSVTEVLETWLHHLADRGIGGERSNGYGSFQLERLAFPWPDWGTGNGYRLLLSRYLPTQAEIQPALQEQPLTAYRLITVGGWLTSPHHPHLRRKQISLLAEGGVVGAEVQGRIVDVRPDWQDFPHPVWRYGLALTLPATVTPVEDV